LKLLLDQNLSPRLVAELEAEFPGSQHVRGLGLASADDLAIWELARQEDFVIVSKDADFHQRSFLYGHPPKVVWVRLGNCSTADVLALLRRSQARLQAFAGHELSSFLVLP
jgi:predicted nuclease of predicted toxin-antitoxin system